MLQVIAFLPHVLLIVLDDLGWSDVGFHRGGPFRAFPAMCGGWYRGTVMVIMLYTMQSKVDWFLTRGKNVLLFSDSTVLIINIIFTLKKIETPKKKTML